MLYELSLYQSAPGAWSKALAALQGLTPRMGQHRLGLWQPDGGARPEHFLMLSQWPDLETRDRIHDPLAADPAWRAASQAFAECEHWIVTPTHGAPELSGKWNTGELFEFRVQEVVNGSQAAAGADFWNLGAPQIAAAGGRVAGQFDVVLGPNRPLFVTILAWPDFQALHEGWRAMDRDEGVARQRQNEIDTLGRPYHDRMIQYLVKSVAP